MPGAQHEDREDRRGLAVDGHAERRQPVADPARRDLGAADGEEREQPEDRAAVDEDQQQEDERERRAEQRPVDAFEDVDEVGGVARAAGDLDLEAAAVDRHPLADRFDRVEDRFALAVVSDLRDHERRFFVARVRGAAEGRGRAQLLAVEDRAIALDDALVGCRQAAIAVIDDDERQQLAALEVLDDLERLRRLGVARQERRRLVLLGLGELGGQVREERTGDGGQPDQRDQPLGATAGHDGEERTHAPGVLAHQADGVRSASSSDGSHTGCLQAKPSQT